MARYDSGEHLQVFTKGGWPKIHDEIYRSISLLSQGRRFIDLCCSTGLLGERIRRGIRGAEVWGVDGDSRAVAAGRQAGVGMPMEVMRINSESLPRLAEFIKRNRINVLVARRCIPELVGDGAVRGEDLVRALSWAGIEEVFLQGRVVTPNAKNPLSSIEREVAVFTGYYLVNITGQVAYLRR